MSGVNLRGCDEHGLDDVSKTWSSRDNQWRWYCNACRRARASKTHYGGSRCHKRGHLKTPWTWRRYSGIWRCMTCQNERRRKRVLPEA